MSELIDRQDAIDRFNVIRPIDPKKDEYTKGIDVGKAMCIVAVKDQPTVQPEPKTGKWLGTEFDGYADGNPVFYEWQCSECGCIFEDEEPTYKFCPNCGTKMKGETK